MKKSILFLVPVLLLFSLCSCVTVKKSIKLHKDRSEIASIDIYNMDTKYYEGNIQELRSENTPVYSLEPSVWQEFLDALNSLSFEKEIVLFPIPMDGGYDYSGYIVSIVYNDGSYHLIAEKGQFSYSLNANGKEGYGYDYSDYSGNKPWSDFIEEYIQN